ncbi:Fe-S-cluster oxidoreductase [Bacterioplanes sanyensis]|uniref:Fe-S-cluster oxidoreductase n=1 Tax=Bacterioplanes sanyensis TaxID=1249553 RepID=A0A222FMU9_9GAMM|nr:Fe-S-cluster oxidoreductase [Bacterioplanes sanyensis]
MQLDDAGLCRLFGDPSRPATCLGFQAEAAICGTNKQQALATLIELEQITSSLLE